MTTPVPGAGSRAVPTVAAGSGSGSVSLFDVDPDAIAARVLACPAVAGLSAGPYGSAVTYLPGRRVAGVRLSPTAVEVHVVAQYGPSMFELAAQVRAALAGRVGGLQVDLVVEDLADPRRPGSTPATGLPATTPAAPAPAVPPALPVSDPALPVSEPTDVVDPTGLVEPVEPTDPGGSRRTRPGRFRRPPP